MAKQILTLNATISSGVINVEGTAEVGMLAAAISVYDADGTNLLFVETTSVAADGTFSYSLNTGASGTYIVSVADYDGSANTNNAMTATVTEASVTNKNVTEKSPKSGFETKAVSTVAPETNASSANFFVVAVVFIACAALGFVVSRRLLARRARAHARVDK